MTTIVYDHKNKQIACDSRETAGGALVTDKAIKYYIRGDDVWFIFRYQYTPYKQFCH